MPRPPREPVNLALAQRRSDAPIQRVLVDLARPQFGVLTRAQLRAAGLSDSAIDRWARIGRLQRLHLGVYAVGHDVLTTEGRRIAAVFACGLRAGLSFTDGGAVWGMCRSRGSRFHVTVPRGDAVPGLHGSIHVHLTTKPFEVVMREGIPVTTPAQTLRDLASVLGDEDVEEAVDAAIELGLYDQRAIDAVCGRGRPGSARLRRVIATRHPEAHASKSGWERRMLRLLEAHALPRAEVNPWLVDLALSPDLLWREAKVVVEWDSWQHHRTRGRFEDDRRKTVVLQSAGYTVLRFTWRHTIERPEWVAAAIRTALSRTGRDHRR